MTSRPSSASLPIIAFTLVTILFSCGPRKESAPEETPEKIVMVPAFSGDSAFTMTERQVKFGPRVPNSAAHRKAGDFLVSKFKSYRATVIVQEFEARSFDGQRLALRNIIASYFPERQKRILVASHWDTRPFADKDKEKPDAPFDGANDGASGVAVLLEIARHLGGANPPNVGIDLILFDGEDWGEKENSSSRVNLPDGLGSWWCLGSQHWSKNKHKPAYSAYYGILLDMVGADGTHFFQEGTSLEYAPKIVEKIWRTASQRGYSSLFVSQKGPEILDDHMYVNEIAKIPMVDIVPYDPQVGSFGDYHHTQKDNLSLISQATLGAVGDVLLHVIYSEE